MKRIICILFLLGVAGCDLLGPRACTTELRPGISLLILDADGGPLASDSVMASAADGEYVDVAIRNTQGAGYARASLAHERAGTYRVEVRGDGYEPWERTRVRVSEGECHVRTVDLQVLLHPAGQE